MHHAVGVWRGRRNMTGGSSVGAGICYGRVDLTIAGRRATGERLDSSLAVVGGYSGLADVEPQRDCIRWVGTEHKTERRRARAHFFHHCHSGGGRRAQRDRGKWTRSERG
jgi:hypothetical protein